MFASDLRHGALGGRELHVEPKVHHVSIGDGVFFALNAKLADLMSNPPEE